MKTFEEICEMFWKESALTNPNVSVYEDLLDELIELHKIKLVEIVDLQEQNKLLHEDYRALVVKVLAGLLWS